MYERAFVATTVALGGTVDEALAAVPEQMPETMRMPDAPLSPDPLAELVAGLRAPARATRAAALATALRDVLIATEELALR
jgi:hypothetical protein